MSQSFNSDAFRGTIDVLVRNQNLMVPHFTVNTITEISPQLLYDQGVRAVVFDKDNTLTAPYINEIFTTLKPVVEQFREVFGENMAILSNSAGTKDDVDYSDANEIESKLGIAVIRHDLKKPEGYQFVQNWFNADKNQIVMIGDRLLTDTLFGNKAGMLTIHTGILTLKGDNFPAIVARFLENKLLNHYTRKGVTAPIHPLSSIQLK